MRKSVALLLSLSACAPVEHAGVPEPAPKPEYTLEFKRTVGDLHTVTVSVGTIDPVGGMVAWEGPHRVGDRIGWGRENGVFTSRHRVRSVDLNRDVDVDFDTGAVIVEIRVAVTIPYDWSYCDVSIKPLATTPCGGVLKRKATYVADQVVYHDREGVRQVAQSPGAPPFVDHLCTLHGGDRKVRELMSPEERQEWVDSQAVPLKAAADDHWRSRNPAVRRKAQPIYKELLEKYACAKIVVDNRETIFHRMNADVED
jgi:hypothetical protein